MAIIKKKDLYDVKLDELIDLDGSPIEGDERYDTTSQINVGVDKAGSGVPELTTDKFAKSSRQGNRYYYGPQGISGSAGAVHKTVGDLPDPRGIGLDFEGSEKELDESINKLAEEKMIKMVEDIISTRSVGNDMVKKTNRPDVDRNNIPDIDELRKSKPVTTNSTIEFVNEFKNEPLQGDEAAIILNYIMSNLDLSTVSPDYKRILRSKL
jgi:hypothetical protein